MDTSPSTLQTTGFITTGSFIPAEPEALPQTIEADRIKHISIIQLDYGYEVKVGCQRLAIEKPETLIAALRKYLKNPAKVEKAWLAGEFEV